MREDDIRCNNYFARPEPHLFKVENGTNAHYVTERTRLRAQRTLD
jgi:hypothetical protein